MFKSMIIFTEGEMVCDEIDEFVNENNLVGVTVSLLSTDGEGDYLRVFVGGYERDNSEKSNPYQSGQYDNKQNGYGVHEFERTITVPNCSCGAKMVVRNRRADGQPFWGCSRFSTGGCKNLQSFTDGEMKSYYKWKDGGASRSGNTKGDDGFGHGMESESLNGSSDCDDYDDDIPF